MSQDSRTRKWNITINNPLDYGLSHDAIKEKLLKLGIDYWCMCDEEGSTYHTHVYAYRSDAIRFSTMKKAFGVAHLEQAKGTHQQNRDYIRKEGKWKNTDKEETNIIETFEESGEVPFEKQGLRSDRADLLDMVNSGMTNAAIIKENPNYIYRIKEIDAIRETLLNEKYGKQKREIEVTYIYGDTGSGKTRYVMDKYGYENVYRVTNYDHPFDGYKGQNVIVFEEFRSSLKCSDMLMYLDIYPCTLPARFNDKTACYTKVFICTNITLDKQYTGIQREELETYNAFMRRIHSVIHMEKGKEPVIYKPNENNGFVPYDGEDFEEIWKK